jgi:hypothetical protein
MRFSILFAFLAALAFPASAQAYDEPKALVAAVYAPYLSGQRHVDVSQFYSARLKQLFLDHAETAAAQADTSEPLEATPAFDFNPFIDAQNALILDVAIGEPLMVGDKALVTVGFHNFDQPTLLSLSLVRDADGWKVDDVTSMGGEENWMLSWLLRFDPWGVM